jgi:hypothetical protein
MGGAESKRQTILQDALSGHFAAMEVPDLWVKEIRAFLKTQENNILRTHDQPTASSDF